MNNEYRIMIWANDVRPDRRTDSSPSASLRVRMTQKGRCRRCYVNRGIRGGDLRGDTGDGSMILGGDTGDGSMCSPGHIV